MSYFHSNSTTRCIQHSSDNKCANGITYPGNSITEEGVEEHRASAKDTFLGCIVCVSPGYIQFELRV